MIVADAKNQSIPPPLYTDVRIMVDRGPVRYSKMKEAIITVA